jgi:hypothetical protein
MVEDGRRPRSHKAVSSEGLRWARRPHEAVSSEGGARAVCQLARSTEIGSWGAPGLFFYSPDMPVAHRPAVVRHGTAGLRQRSGHSSGFGFGVVCTRKNPGQPTSGMPPDSEVRGTSAARKGGGGGSRVRYLRRGVSPPRWNWNVNSDCFTFHV